MYTTFNHYHQHTDTIDIILHGGSVGLDSDFIKSVFNNSVVNGHSVLAFNFPYYDRGDTSSSGEALLEEQEAILKYLEYIRPFGYTKINFIAKSLGGIVLSKFLSNHKLPADYQLKDIVVMGFVVGQVDFSGHKGHIKVIQGSEDKFGNDVIVKSELIKQGLDDYEIIPIKAADHSYNTPNTKDNKYVEAAVMQIFCK